MSIGKFQFIGSLGHNIEPVGREVREIEVDGVRFVPERTCEGCAIPERDYGHAPSPCGFCARNNDRYDLFTPKVVK